MLFREQFCDLPLIFYEDSFMIVQQAIEEKLQQALQPSFLTVENESHLHNVPPGSEKHFKVVAVSELFEGQGKVARHQRVYAVLQEEMAGPVHALALHLYTPSEWQGINQQAPVSPQCMGGHKSN